MSNDVIQLHQFLAKVPRLILTIPKIVQALGFLHTGPDEPTGLGWILEKAVRKNPDGIAVYFEDRRITYRDFNAWVNRIAHFFISKGVKKGDVVAIYIENRPEMLACAAAMAKIGAVSALINTSQTGKVLINNYNLVKPKLAVVGEELVPQFDEVRSKLETGRDAVYFLADQDTLKNEGKAPAGYINLAAAVAGFSEDNPDTTSKIFKPDQCFYIYTSGTTGLPKAAIFSHGRLMKAYGGFGIMTLRLGKKDVMYITLPLYHSTALIMNWGPALVGAAAVALRRKFSSSEFWNDTRKYNVTSFGYVGEVCRYLMNVPPKANDADNPVVSMVGTGLRPTIWKEFKKRFGIKYVFESYASSEGPAGFVNVLGIDNSVGTTPDKYALVKYDKEEEKPVLNKKGFMQKVKKGESGLLLTWIDEKKSVFDGYTDSEANKKIVLKDVFKKGDKWFNTGDMMKDLGFRHLQFVDRLGDTYRWKGENVSTTEVENIINEFKNISEAVAYGVEIPNTNGRAGMAVIIFDDPKKMVDFKEFYTYLSGAMPPYAVPVFLRIKEIMATTGTFKYKKTDLKKEGFNINEVKDPVYAVLPGAKEYVKVTLQIYKDIMSGKYRY